jgi:RNA polymerase sigma-70 factor, ECF subfamily
MERTTLEALAASHEDFLAFLTPRVESRAVAEDILQAAFIKGLETDTALRDEASATAYFYRQLRRALVDYYRRRDVERRAQEREAREADLSTEDEHALDHTVCACVKRLVGTLSPAHASILRAVDVEGSPVVAFARAEGVSPNAAMVRLHRARTALRERLLEACGTCCVHLCMDCECTGEPRPAGPLPR